MLGRRSHPAAAHLALLAGGDLPWLTAILAKRHLRQCPVCRAYFHGLEEARTELRREADLQMLTGYEAIADFSAIEREMLGNISVGLAAARCVETVEVRHRWRKAVLITAGLSALFTVAWWTHVPAEETKQLASKLGRWATGEATVQPAGIFMRSGPDGLAVRSQGTTLTMQHPRTAIVSVAGSGTMEARFVDEETGQVTISSVYGQ